MFLLQSFHFDPISIVLVVGVICFIIVGAIRGFFHVLIDLAQSVLSLIVSVILAKPLGMLLYKTGYFSNAIEKTADFLLSRNEIFSEIITNDNKTEVLSKALSNLHIPSRLNSLVISIGEKIIPNTNNMQIADFISDALFVGVSIVLAGAALYLLIFIMVLLLRIFVKKFDEIKPINKFNHFLGGVIGLANGLVFVIICLALLTGLLMIPSLNISIGNIIKLHDENTFTIAKWLYNLDIFSIIFSWFGI